MPRIMSSTLCAVCLAIVSCSAAEVEQATIDPKALAVAERSFELYRDLKFDEYAQLVYDEDLIAFREYLGFLWETSEAEGESASLAKALGVESRAELLAADPAALLARFMRSNVDKQPGQAEDLARAKFRLLGHVVEGDDKVYVLTLDAPGEAGLYPLSRTDSGEWKLRLKSDPRAQIVVMRMVFQWKQEGKSAQEMRVLLGRPSVVSANLLGLVAEDADTVHAVVRGVTRVESLNSEENIVSVHAIGSDTDVWPALNGSDPASIPDEDRRSKIEAALLRSWNGAATASERGVQ